MKSLGLLISTTVLLLLGCSSAEQQKSIDQKQGPAYQTYSFAAWLPKYPSIQEDSSSDSLLKFTTTDRASDVIAFYEQRLKSSGFAVGGQPNTGILKIADGSFLFNAERRSGGEYIKLEMAVQEQGPERTVVVGHWTSSR